MPRMAVGREDGQWRMLRRSGTIRVRRPLPSAGRKSFQGLDKLSFCSLPFYHSDGFCQIFLDTSA